MRALSAYELLSIWERGHEQSPPDRALALLQVACPDTTADDLAGLTVGQRDAGLLELREQTFGSQLVGSAECPACGERLELAFRVGDVLVSPFEEPGSSAEDAVNRAGSFRDGQFHIEFRLPTARDLGAVAKLDDAPAARRFLLDRCLLAVDRGGENQAADSLPDEITNAVIQRMAELDPQGETHLALCCPACEHRWKMLLDIVSFFWTEIHAWAQRILREVHTLASAYGWREADILAMSPLRRQLYLEMVGG
jgi:hypothetical protein